MANGRRYAVGVVAIVAIGAVIAWISHRRGSAEHAHAAASTSSEHGGPNAKDPRAKSSPGLAAGARQIAGTVSFDGAPLAGASVRLVDALSSAELRVVTDPAGRFDFGRHLAARYAVVAEMPKLTGALASIDLRDPTAQPDQLRLVLHACDASLHGMIRDTAGGVIAKARVGFLADDASASAGTDADDAGSYELCVPVGETQVLVKADGYAQTIAYVATYGRVRHDFALSPEAIVRGRVVRADDRSPVGGALVELVGVREWPLTRPALHATSDGDGMFHFEGVAPGRVMLTATAERLATAQPIDVIAEIGKSPDPIVCPLVPTLEVSGKVIEHGTDTPLTGIAVTLYANTFSAGTSAIEVPTQADGSFVIAHVLPGDYQVATELQLGAGVLPRAVKVGNTDVAGVVLEVDRLASVSGRVTRDGKPVDQAQVHARGVAAVNSVSNTDADGHFTLRGLRPGAYSIYAESKRVGAFSSGPEVTVAAGEHKTGVDVELDLAASISGVVVDQTGTPVSGAFVRLSLLGGADWGSATTAEDGRFTARALAGGGDYALRVGPSETSTVVYRPARARHFAPIAVKDARTQVTGVRIEISFERLAISGRVIDSAGKPIADAAVVASAGERSWFGDGSATTDLDGKFAIHDLAAGKYQLRVRAARGEQLANGIAAGRDDVVISLADLGGIEGSLEGFAEAPIVAATRVGNREWGTYHATLVGNMFVVRDVPAGSYRVEASSSAGVASAAVTVSPSATAKVALHARGLGAIEGLVVDGTTRAPLAGLYCSATTGDGDVDVGRRFAVTDATGAFRFDRVAAGTGRVACSGEAGGASASVNVIAGQTTRLELASHPRPKPPPRGHVGLVLADEPDEIVVQEVEAGGPAARAGLQPGDVVVSVGKLPIKPDDPAGINESELVMALIEDRPIGTVVKLGIERGDAKLDVQVTVEAAPSP